MDSEEGQEITSLPEVKSQQNTERDSEFRESKMKTAFRTSVAPMIKITTDPTTTTSMVTRGADLRIRTTLLPRRPTTLRTTTIPFSQSPTTLRTTTTSLLTTRPHTQITTTPIFNRQINTETTTTSSPPIRSPNSLPRETFTMPGGDPQGRFIQSVRFQTVNTISTFFSSLLTRPFSYKN